MEKEVLDLKVKQLEQKIRNSKSIKEKTHYLYDLYTYDTFKKNIYKESCNIGYIQDNIYNTYHKNLLKQEKEKCVDLYRLNETTAYLTKELLSEVSKWDFDLNKYTDLPNIDGEDLKKLVKEFMQTLDPKIYDYYLDYGTKYLVYTSNAFGQSCIHNIKKGNKPYIFLNAERLDKAIHFVHEFGHSYIYNLMNQQGLHEVKINFIEIPSTLFEISFYRFLKSKNIDISASYYDNLLSYILMSLDAYVGNEIFMNRPLNSEYLDIRNSQNKKVDTLLFDKDYKNILNDFDIVKNINMIRYIYGLVTAYKLLRMFDGNYKNAIDYCVEKMVEMPHKTLEEICEDFELTSGFPKCLRKDIKKYSK